MDELIRAARALITESHHTLARGEGSEALRDLAAALDSYVNDHWCIVVEEPSEGDPQIYELANVYGPLTHEQAYAEAQPLRATLRERGYRITATPTQLRSLDEVPRGGESPFVDGHCPACGSPEDAADVTCPRCGHMANALLCNECRLPLDGDEGPYHPECTF